MLKTLIGPPAPPPERWLRGGCSWWFRWPVTQTSLWWVHVPEKVLLLFTSTNIFINTVVQSNKNPLRLSNTEPQSQCVCHWDACCLAAMTFDYLRADSALWIKHVMWGLEELEEPLKDTGTFTYSNLSSKLLHISFHFPLNTSNCGAVVSEKLLLGNICTVDRQSSTEMIDFSSIFNWKLIICVEQWHQTSSSH